MATTSRITELTSIIQHHTAAVDDHLSKLNAPEISFAPDGSDMALMDPAILLHRMAVLDATDELNALLQGPMGLLTTPIHNSLIGLHVIVRFDLARSFPPNKERATFREISDISGLPEDAVRRILRQAMAFHIFCEPEKGVVAHTAASKLLATNPLVGSMTRHVLDEMWPASTKVAEALAKWPGSSEPHHTAFNIARNTQLNAFDWLAQNPEQRSRYTDTMTVFSSRPGFEASRLADHYPWGALAPGSVVVDVGGSLGHVSIEIAKRFSDLKFIVQDIPAVIEDGRDKLPTELSQQIQFLKHDFFQAQPVKGADVYLFRFIFHDWPDSYAIRILRALVPALKPGAKIVVNDNILPVPGTISAYRDGLMRCFDLAMLEYHGGKERDLDDWNDLCQQADARFRVVKTHQPLDAVLGVLEIEWTDVVS